MNWKGVMPAITTSFTEDLRVDHNSVTKHCRWLLDNGCAGIVALGSLGEGRDAVVRREAPNPANLCRRDSRARTSGGVHLRTHYFRSRGPRESSR